MRGKGCSSLVFGVGCPGQDRACPAIFCSDRCELEIKAFKLGGGRTGGGGGGGGRGMLPKISKRDISTTTIKSVECGKLNVPLKVITAQVQDLAGV